MNKTLSILVFLLSMAFQAHAAATAPGTYFVTVDRLNVRLAPQAGATIMKTLKRHQKVKVLKVRKGWARIAGSDGAPLWVAARYLTASAPAGRTRETLPDDPRIKGLPAVGQDGATAKDVRTLYEIAQYFLQSGKCDHVEFADRQHSQPGTYTLRCGGKNYYYRPSGRQILNKGGNN